MNVIYIGITSSSVKKSPMQSHGCWEIILNIQGEGIEYIGDNECKFFPGTITCIPPNVSHGKTAKNEFKDIYIMAYRVSPMFAEDRSAHFVDDERKSLETLFMMILRAFHKRDQNYRNVIDSLFEAIVQLLISRNTNTNRVINKDMELFRDELIENFTNPEYSISKAYERISYCHDYFGRCFKKYFGTTPSSYLMSLRIEYAKRLLEQKSNVNLPISKIAVSCGFYDSNYFSRIFRAKVGVTPREYLNNRNAQVNQFSE